jgi:hypothetical protein
MFVTQQSPQRGECTGPRPPPRARLLPTIGLARNHGMVAVPQQQPLQQAIRVAADPVTVLEWIVQQALVLLPQADGKALEV